MFDIRQGTMKDDIDLIKIQNVTLDKIKKEVEK